MDNVYGIIGSLAVTILGWLLPFLWGNSETRLLRKWMCKKRSDASRYVKELLLIVFIGVGLVVIGLLLIGILDKELIENYNFVMPQIMKNIFASSLSTVCLILMMITVAKREPKCLIRGKKNEKMLRFFLNYAPFFSVLFLCNIAIYLNNFILDFVLMSIIWICEICAYIFLDSKNKAEYKYAHLSFNDGSQVVCLTENISQRGNWIIAKVEESEIRNRQDELKNVRFYNFLTE